MALAFEKDISWDRQQPGIEVTLSPSGPIAALQEEVFIHPDPLLRRIIFKRFLAEIAADARMTPEKRSHLNERNRMLNCSDEEWAEILGRSAVSAEIYPNW